MLDPQRPIADYLDDYLHDLLDEADAARVQAWIDASPEGAAALTAAQQRREVLASLPPCEASERLIRSTLADIETKATTRSPWKRRVVYGFVALAATALVMIGSANVYYYNLAPSSLSLRLLGQSQLLANAPAALRVALVDQHTGRALPGIAVTLAMVHPTTHEVVELASFQSTNDATQSPRFQVPDWTGQNVRLRVTAHTSHGDEVLEESITLRRAAKLYLSTDKPIYQPGQTIHLRALALRRPDLKPVTKETVEFRVFDAKENQVFKHRAATSKFGIVAADCPLADELNQGQYRIECVLGDTTSTRTVKVEKYVLPKFKIGIDLNKSFYQPGEQVSGNLAVNYFFGQPVARAKAKLEVRTADTEQQLLHQQTLTLDEQGKVPFQFALPSALVGREQDSGMSRVQIFAIVTDTAGQTITHAVSRLITAEPLQLEVISEAGSLVPGLSNRVYVHASYADGRPAVVSGEANGEHKFSTNELGVGSFEIAMPDTGPSGNVTMLTIVARDAAGATARKHLTFAVDQFPNDFIVRPSKSVYRGGETVSLSALGHGVEPIFVDLLKDNQTMLSQAIAMSGGKGTLDIDLPAELTGSIQLVTYRFDATGLAVRKSRLVFVEPAQQLQITTTLDQPQYRPGEKAKLTFQLLDANKQPVAGAISLVAVDEAVYSVLDQRPGLEQAFFLAEEQWMQPIYTIYPDWSPDNGTTPPAREMLQNAVFSLTAHTAADEVSFADSDPSRSGAWSVPKPIEDHHSPFAAVPFTLVANSYPAKVQVSDTQRTHGLQMVAFAWFGFLAMILLFGTIAFAVMQPKIFMVVAGVLLVLMMCGLPMAFLTQRTLEVSSAKVAADATKSMPPPNAAAPAEWARSEAGEEELAPAEMATPGNAAAPPRVRKHFPETLLWQPELITDEQGVATLDLDLADSITTWRLAASAVNAAGQLGQQELPIKVFQPFFVDLHLPVSLTRGDAVTVPVVVYNYLDQPQTVTIELAAADWFTLQASENAASPIALKQELTLQPGEVKSLPFPIIVQQVGQQTLTVTATAGNVADASERTIEVVPNGLPVEVVQNTALPGDGAAATITHSLPDDIVPGSLHAYVKFQPAGFGQLLEGMDAIFRMPYGCFEQTSSTTYPNVLALDYLRSTNRSAPAVEAKARQYIHLGYQRLVSFEVTGGGFDWFGNPPANRTLTAYGLLEFVDMTRVHDVDPQLIARTRAWLLSQQRPDGSWEPEPHMINDGLASSVNRGDNASLAASAYIAWSVFHSLPPGDRNVQQQRQLQRTADYLLAHRPHAINDPYVLATVALALAAYDPQHAELPPYLARLDELKTTEGKVCYWKQPAQAARPFYAAGASGDIETTALATLALLTAKRPGNTTQGALGWLVLNKDAQGTWHSTQATVLALKALLKGTSSASAEQERRFVILVNDEEVQQLTIAPDQADVLRQIDLTTAVAKHPRDFAITVKELTDSGTNIQTVIRYHRTGEAAEPAAQQPLAINIAYDRQRLAVAETVTATATIVNQMNQVAPMVIVDLPIPGGFQLEAGELDELVGSRSIEKYQLTPRQAIIYLRQLPPGGKLELRYRLRATLPVKVAVPPAEVYEYYNPTNRAKSQASQIEAIKT